MIDPRLLGRWMLVSEEQELRVAEFEADGRLTYRVDLVDRQLVLLLAFRVEESEIVTTQPPQHEETRSHYELPDADTLVMQHGSEPFTYRRMP